MWLTVSVLIVAWIHGGSGLYFWCRMKPFLKVAAPYLLAAAVLVPTMATLGLYQAGREVTRQASSPEWRAENLSDKAVGTPAQPGTLERITEYFLIGYLALIPF